MRMSCHFEEVWILSTTRMMKHIYFFAAIPSFPLVKCLAQYPVDEAPIANLQIRQFTLPKKDIWRSLPEFDAAV